MPITDPTLPASPIARRAIEDALHAWLAAGTGLGVDRVFWQAPGVTPPSFPFATLSWLSTVTEGVDAVIFEDIGDESEAPPDMRYHAAGLRLVTISLQVFEDVSETGSAPEASAGMRLDAAVAKLGLPTVRDALRAAGFANARGTVARRVVDGQWNCEVSGYVKSSVSEDIYSIQTVGFVPADDLTPIGEFFEPPIVPAWAITIAEGANIATVDFEFEGVEYTALRLLGTSLETFEVTAVGELPAYAFVIGRGGVGGASQEITGTAGGGGGGGGWAAGVPSSDLGTHYLLEGTIAGPLGEDLVTPLWLLAAGFGGAGGAGGANGVAGGSSIVSGTMVSSSSRGASGGGGGGDGGLGGAAGTGDVNGHAGHNGGTGGDTAGGGGGGVHSVGTDGAVDGGSGGNGHTISPLATAAITALVDVSLSVVGAGGGGGASLTGTGGEPGTGGEGNGSDQFTNAGAGVGYGAGGGGGWAPVDEAGGGRGPALSVFVYPR